MKKMYQSLIILVTIILYILPIQADTEIEELTKNSLLQAQGSINDNAAGELPGFDKDAVDQMSQELGNLDDSQMRSKAEEKFIGAKEDSPLGIVKESHNVPDEPGLENHEMFEIGDKVAENPESLLATITGDSCKTVSQESKPIKTIKKKVIVKDIESYEETCEQPAGNIVCEKTLEVGCEKTEECEAGGIVEGSMDTGIEWEYNYPNLRLGNPGTEYLPYCGGCCSKKMFASFDLKNIKEIKTFALKKVFLKNYLQVKFNGHVVYNNLGGNKLEIQQRENTHGESCATRKSRYMVDTGANVSSCLLNMCERGVDNVDIDLREYLKEGRNTVEMEVVWSDRGHIHIEIEAKQQCCTKLKDKWSKRCWQE